MRDSRWPCIEVIRRVRITLKVNLAVSGMDTLPTPRPEEALTLGGISAHRALDNLALHNRNRTAGQRFLTSLSGIGYRTSAFFRQGS